MKQETEIIKEYFGERKGRFLEIGAFDGFTDSLTAPLIDEGWSAVLVEPEPYNFNRLAERYDKHPRVELVHAAISDRGGLLRFWGEYGGGQHGTISAPMRDAFIKHQNIPFKTYFVAAVTGDELVSAIYGFADLQLVVIDAEDANLSVLYSLPLREMTYTEMLVVEWDLSGEQAMEIALQRCGYRVHAVVHPNIIALRNVP